MDIMAILTQAINEGTIPFLIRQTLIYAVPLMIVALAGVFSERSGVINLALEGIMIFGAFVGVLFVRLVQQWGWFEAAYTAKNWMTLQGFALMTMCVSAVLGAAFAMLLAFAAINLKADQTIGGTALNLMAPALVLFFVRILANQNTLQMFKGDSAGWFMLKESLFGFGVGRGVNKTPSMGFFGQVFINKVYPMTYVCILIFIILAIILYKTKFGLRLRACGEHPQAADSVGVNVYKIRYAGVLISGALGGIGGMAYIIPSVSSWNFEVGVSGAGFLALAVMIFGQWKPFRIFFAAVFFALFKSLANIASSIPAMAALGWTQNMYNMIPFIASMIILAFTSKKSRAPKAEGIPYDKGSR